MHTCIEYAELAAVLSLWLMLHKIGQFDLQLSLIGPWQYIACVIPLVVTSNGVTDAGLYAKPEVGRALVGDGITPSITLFSLPQVYGPTLCSTSASLGDMPDKVEESRGRGFGLSALRSCLLSSMSDVVFVNADGKKCVVLGMHVHHASP